MKMKILMCEPSGAGKLSHYTFSLCHALQGLGHDVTLMTAKEYETAERRAGFQIEKVYHRQLPYHYARIIRYVRMERPNAIHFQGVRKSDLPLLTLLRHFKGSKLVYTSHHVLPHRRRFYHLPVYERLYRLMDEIIVHTDYDREAIIDLFRARPERIHVIPEGSYELYKKGVSREDARKDLDIPLESQVMLFFGYINRQKGVDGLLRAFKDVIKGLPESRLIIAGDAGKDSGRYERSIKELGIEAGVVREFGYIPMERVETFFAATDIVVLPYLRAIRGPVVQLAYTFGRPVVATRTGLCGLVEDGKSGYTVPTDDPKALADTIIRLFSDREGLERMSSYCAELSRTRYSWEGIAEETAQIYSC